MDSSSIKEIRKIAEDYDRSLLANDPRFRRNATLVHQDGSYLHFSSAFLMTIRKDWLVVFSEHHRRHIYHTDEILLRWETQKLHIPIEEIEE